MVEIKMVLTDVSISVFVHFRPLTNIIYFDGSYHFVITLFFYNHFTFRFLLDYFTATRDTYSRHQ